MNENNRKDKKERKEERRKEKWKIEIEAKTE